jgi:hypothetical protein
MQSDDPGQPAQHAEPSPEPPPGEEGSGQGAASACARMKLQRELLAGQKPVEPVHEADAV